MSYQALYRKYRIKNFTEMVGQGHISQTLVNALKSEKVAHAYLFSGPRGTGKTSTAKLVAQALNCTGEEVICGHCDMCQLIMHQETSDIIEIDAASNNGVDEIRELRDKVKYAPSHGEYKVYIIDETHMLTSQAFNALLKTLEEPPKHVIFILATTEPHKIPLTILSRCQRFDFKKVGLNAIMERLKIVCDKEKIDITDEAMELIAHISDGGMRDALSLLDQCYSYNVEQIQKEDVLKITGSSSQESIEILLKNIVNGERKHLLTQITKLNDEGYDLILLVDNILIYLRDTIVMSSIGGDVKYYNEQFMHELVEKLTPNGLFLLIDKLSVMLSQMKLMTNAKLFLEVTLLQVCNEFNGLELTLPIKAEEESEAMNVEGSQQEEQVNHEKRKTMEREYVKYLNEVRVNNILALAQKDLLQKVQTEWERFDVHTAELEFGSVATILREGRVRAASSEGIIVSFRQDVLVNRLISDLRKVEEFLLNVFKVKLKMVTVTEREWVKIKDDYIRKLRRGQNYEVQREKSFEEYYEIKKPVEKIVEDAYAIFGDSVIVEEENEY